MLQIETKQQRKIKEQILECMEEVLGVPRELWEYRRTRKNDEVTIRHIYGYFLRIKADMTLQSIANQMGHRNHTTIINSLKLVENWLSMPTMYRRECQIIKAIEKEYGEKYPDCISSLVEQGGSALEV
jgi:chromosomal replication initiation ATPase DnaA